MVSDLSDRWHCSSVLPAVPHAHLWDGWDRKGLVSLTKSIRMVVRELITGRATRGEDDGDEDEDSREADDEHR